MGTQKVEHASVWATWLLLFVSAVGATAGFGCAGATVVRSNPAVDDSEPSVQVEPASYVPAPPIVADATVPARDDDMYAGLLSGEEQRAALCSRDHEDVVTDQLCSAGPIRGLVDLQAALGLAFAHTTGNGVRGNPSFALLGHSTSLSARRVSAVNPRAFLFTTPASTSRLTAAPRPNPDFVALAFTRGEQFVELVARDRRTRELRFFLVRFSQACNEPSAHGSDGCTAFDLYSPRIERDWREISIYDDSDLRGTTLDCLVCHQPNGPNTEKILRMHELQLPWTHFFREDAGGKRLVGYYYRAHGAEEAYAGIPGVAVRDSQPTRLEGMVENEGFQAQPNEFPTLRIAVELSKPRSSARDSAGWQALEKGALESGVFPVPYSAVSASDTNELEAAIASYSGAIASAKAGTEQPAMRALEDLHADDARIMTGLAPPSGAGGREILERMCRRCHNAHLDPSLSRALFDVDAIESMSREEREKAVERMRLPVTSRRKMPPVRAGELNDAEVEAVARFLLDEERG